MCKRPTFVQIFEKTSLIPLVSPFKFGVFFVTHTCSPGFFPCEVCLVEVSSVLWWRSPPKKVANEINRGPEILGEGHAIDNMFQNPHRHTPGWLHLISTIISWLFRMFFGHSSGSFRQETKNCNMFHWFILVSWDDRVKHFQHGRSLSFVGRLDFLWAPTPSERSCNQPACRWSHCQWFWKAAEWQCQWCLCNTWRYWA